MMSDDILLKCDLSIPCQDRVSRLRPPLQGLHTSPGEDGAVMQIDGCGTVNSTSSRSSSIIVFHYNMLSDVVSCNETFRSRDSRDVELENSRLLDMCSGR